MTSRMEWIKALAATCCAVALAANMAHAQTTLDGLPRVAQWTDFENQTGEMPAKIWGSCDVDKADRVGIRVDFQNGISGYAVYPGVAELWNTLNFSPILPDLSGGFLASCFGIHFLYNNATSLPLAWNGCVMAFSTNFDLDYNDQNGSQFRADTPGWVQATFQTYCGGAAPQAPTPQVGLWWNPDESGSGYNLDFQHGVLVLLVYSYTPAGDPLWYIATGPLVGDTFTGQLDKARGGQCISCPYAGMPLPDGSDGTVTIVFHSNTSATMTLPGGRVTQIQPEAF
jgi:hypothetical protein